MTELNVKSLIARPLDGSIVRQTTVEVMGVAFTGSGKVVKLEVSFDGGQSWVESALEEPQSVGSWQQWRWQWRPERPGKYQILARATDSFGNTQPRIPAWNPSGYLWNGFDQIECEVVS